MKRTSSCRSRLVLPGLVMTVVLSAANAWGAGFRDDFNRPDGEVGNGWETFISRRGYNYDLRYPEGNIEVKVVDNEVLIAGQQTEDWAKSGISRFVDGETRFSFDFKADDRFSVIISLSGAEDPKYAISFYASPGGPFSYMWNFAVGNWTAWTQIPGSQMIAGQYNTLVIEHGRTEFVVTLNGKVVGTVANEGIRRIGQVFISGDAAFGVVGSLHIDNVVIDQPLVTNFDFNGDGIVDVKDVVTLTDHWGQDYSVCDISPKPYGDGIVDAKDLLALAYYLEQETALIAHWPLDETEGMYAADSVGNNDDIVIGRALWQPDGGQVDGGLELNGTTFIAAKPPVNPADGPFSVLAWIKGGAPGQSIVSQSGSANWLMADATTGALGTELSKGGRADAGLSSSAIITDGNWHRIAFTWDNVHRRLYVDGVLAAEDTHDSLGAASGNLIIGGGKDMAPGTFWTGLIDDVRIYRRPVRP